VCNKVIIVLWEGEERKGEERRAKKSPERLEKSGDSRHSYTTRYVQTAIPLP
jgi:hypothetical protein